MKHPPIEDHRHNKTTYVRPNRLWLCGENRQHCPHGPDANGVCHRQTPCTPRSSVKKRNKQFTYIVLAIGIALLALLLSNDNLYHLLSPGPLTVGHEEVTSCQDCHQAADAPMTSWIHKAVRLTSFDDSKKCLLCHTIPENADNPHTAPMSVLQNSNPQTVPGYEPDIMVNVASTIQEQYADNIACSNCHIEHKGEFASLTAFESDKCHICHQVKFDRIENGHPEYQNFPYMFNTQIHYDHISHSQKHFIEDEYIDKAPLGCRDCHNLDTTGEWMLTESFETSCSQCHLSQIQGRDRATQKGLSVFAIPELDIETLTQAGLNVGEWPKWADGELTPIARFLLQQHDEELNTLLNNEDIVLYDLSQLEPGDLEQVAVLAWNIKEFLYDLQTGGGDFLQHRLKQQFSSEPNQKQLAQLVASLPYDTLMNNQVEWFPKLLDEIPRWRAGEINLHTPVTNAEQRVTVTEQDHAIDILPSEEIIQQDEISIDDIIDIRDEEILADDDIEILSDDSDILSDDDILLDDDIAILTDDSNILSDDELLLDEDGDDLSDSAATTEDDLTAEDWAALGGWYREGSQIRYRPTFHADPFFQTWLDMTAQSEAYAERRIFKSLTIDQAIGSCTKCHSQAPDNSINWHSYDPALKEIDFNRFSHVAHFSLMTDDGCSSCHILGNEPDDETTQALPFSAGFISMPRNTCTQCHQSGRAPDDCLTCHQYHVTPVRAAGDITDALPSATYTESGISTNE